mgnify:CR=1 FL=1
MLKNFRTKSVVFLVSLTTEFASAQLDGCVDSPENPTVVLAVIGLAGALVPTLKERLSKRHDPDQKIAGDKNDRFKE